MRYWSDINPRELCQKPFIKTSNSCLVRIVKSRDIGPYLLEERNHAVKKNFERYRHRIED